MKEAYGLFEKWQQEHDITINLFDTNLPKYFIVYELYTNRFFIDKTFGCLTFNEVYFSSEEVAKQCLNECSDKLKIIVQETCGGKQ